MGENIVSLLFLVPYTMFVKLKENGLIEVPHQRERTAFFFPRFLTARATPTPKKSQRNHLFNDRLLELTTNFFIVFADKRQLGYRRFRSPFTAFGKDDG